MPADRNNLVIFGTGQIAELAWFYFVHDSPYTPVAFTVDGEFLENESFHGLPVVPFEEVEQHFPLQSHSLFVALSYMGLNSLRADKVAQGRKKGYQLARYVSSRASVFPGFDAGDNSFILEDNTIQPFVRIGSNVTMWSGNHIGHHSVIGDDCFISSHVVISGNCEIGQGCFIGVNATLRDNINIGERSVIGAGAVILGDVEAEGVYPSSGTERARMPSSRLRKI